MTQMVSLVVSVQVLFTYIPYIRCSTMGIWNKVLDLEKIMFQCLGVLLMICFHNITNCVSMTPTKQKQNKTLTLTFKKK